MQKWLCRLESGMNGALETDATFVSNEMLSDAPKLGKESEISQSLKDFW